MGYTGKWAPETKESEQVKIPLRKMTKTDVQWSLDNQRERIRSVTAYALKLNTDPDKKERPNSLYFQHKVPFSETPQASHWNWPPRN